MKKTKKPFFAKFLENQIKSDEQETAKGGAQNGGKTTAINGGKPGDQWITLKYPSDADEDYLPMW